MPAHQPQHCSRRRRRPPPHNQARRHYRRRPPLAIRTSIAQSGRNQRQQPPQRGPARLSQRPHNLPQLTTREPHHHHRYYPTSTPQPSKATYRRRPPLAIPNAKCSAGAEEGRGYSSSSSSSETIHHHTIGQADSSTGPSLCQRRDHGTLSTPEEPAAKRTSAYVRLARPSPARWDAVVSLPESIFLS